MFKTETKKVKKKVKLQMTNFFKRTNSKVEKQTDAFKVMPMKDTKE